MVTPVLCLSAIAGIGCGGSRGDMGSSSEVALRKYRSGLEADAATLVSWIGRMERALERRRVTAAQSHYGAARVPLGHLKPFLIAFPDLNVRLDAGWGKRRGKQLTGFRLVERLLWTDHPMKMRQKAVRGLFLDVKRFQKEVKTARLDPEGIARRINEVMSGPVLRALSGDREPVARIDLVDLSADIEGVEAAFEAIEPLLLKRRPDLAKRIRANFDHFYEEMAPFGTPAREPEQPRPQAPGASYVIYAELKPSALQNIRLVLNELIKRLSEVLAA